MARHVSGGVDHRVALSAFRKGPIYGGEEVGVGPYLWGSSATAISSFAAHHVSVQVIHQSEPVPPQASADDRRKGATDLATSMSGLRHRVETFSSLRLLALVHHGEPHAARSGVARRAELVGVTQPAGVRSMTERSPIWLSPQGLPSFLPALTGALPSRCPRSAPPGRDGGQGLREGKEKKMSTDQPTEAGAAYRKTVDQARTAYEEVLAPAKKAYDEALELAEKAYDEARAPAEKAYNEVLAPAEKAYEETVAPARKVYDEAVAPARKAYDEAVAPAAKAYKEAMASAAKAYDDAMAPAQKAYDEAGSAATKTYDEAMAPGPQGLP